MPAKRISAVQIIATPEGESLAELRAAAEECRACPLWKHATRTVFGEGPDNAKILMIGEQPGDEEDRSGHPFVGPAGKLLDSALAELGIDRARIYVTNAVKHFKFELRGKRRLHKSPNRSEQRACLPWLLAEIGRVRPRRIICLGATAAQAVFGPSFRLMKNRGAWHVIEGGARAFATVHPSFVLRQRDGESREREYRAFVGDLLLLKD
jgi:uracil-DNA glycosylase